MEKLNTNNAPAAIGPYSQAVKTGNLLFTSGQIALNPATGEIVGTTIEEQTEQVLHNLFCLFFNCCSNNWRTDRTGYEEPWSYFERSWSNLWKCCKDSLLFR